MGTPNEYSKWKLLMNTPNEHHKWILYESLDYVPSHGNPPSSPMATNPSHPLDQRFVLSHRYECRTSVDKTVDPESQSRRNGDGTSHAAVAKTT